MTRLAVGSTIRRALQLCRAEWWTLIALALLVEIPVVIADSLSIHLLDLEIGGTDELGERVVGALVLLLWTTLSHHVLLAAVEEVEASYRRGVPRTRIVNILRGLPFGRLLLADVLITVAVVVGVALLIVPGLVAYVYTTPVFPLITMERQPLGATFRRSVRIVRGNFWRLFAVIGVVLLASQLAGAVVTTFFHSEPFLDTVFHHVAVLVFEPLSAAAVVVATYELVAIDRRKEPAVTG